jgi:hypothetical protein
MRTAQFWILLLSSCFISVLYIKQIFLSRDLNHQQRNLVDSQQVISDGSEYENAWKQLALHMYEASKDDPALTGILKKENIDIRPKEKAAPLPSNPPTTSPAQPSAPPKVAVPPVHAGTP